MDISTQTQPPSVPPVRRRSPKPVLLIIAGILLLILIALGYAFRSYWLPSEMGDLRISRGLPAEALFTLHDAKLKDLSVKTEGTLRDYILGKHGTGIGIVSTEGNDMIVPFGPSKSAKVNMAGTKASLVLSKSGMYAYAEPAPGSISTSSDKWAVMLVDADRITTRLGIGYAPQFFERDGVEYLLYQTPYGISVLDLKERMTQTTFLSHSTDLHAVVVDPSGNFLFIKDPLTGHYAQYSIKSVLPQLVINPVAILSEPVSSLAFAHGTLYGILNIDGASKIVKYDLDQLGAGVPVVDLPAASVPYYLLP